MDINLIEEILLQKISDQRQRVDHNTNLISYNNSLIEINRGLIETNRNLIDQLAKDQQVLLTLINELKTLLNTEKDNESA